MKYIFIGDIHGRTNWKQIVEKEKDADKFIFFGDYFDPYDWTLTLDDLVNNFRDILDFKILKIDEKDKKISGGIKQLTISPWKEVEDSYKVGNKVKAVVEKQIESGLLVKLTDRFSGLIPKKEASKENENIEYNDGDEVEAVIIEMNEKKKSVILSIKRVSEMEEEKELKELLAIYGVDQKED